MHLELLLDLLLVNLPEILHKMAALLLNEIFTSIPFPEVTGGTVLLYWLLAPPRQIAFGRQTWVHTVAHSGVAVKEKG